MATYFPANPTVNDVYQPEGSTTQYIWTGTYWRVENNTRPIFDGSLSGSIATIDAAGYVKPAATTLINGVLQATASIATSASFATSASRATTSSFATSASLSVSASFATSASLSVSASFATSASLSQTASRVSNIDMTPLSGTTIPSGSGFIYQTGRYVVDVVEGLANNNIAFVTPWNFSLKMDQSGQQFYIAVDSAGTSRYAWGFRSANYYRIISSAGSTSNVYVTWSAPVANAWYAWWQDTTLNLTAHGDSEWGIFRTAPSQTAFSLGQYEEYEVYMVLGDSYNNNYFRVRKTK